MKDVVTKHIGHNPSETALRSYYPCLLQLRQQRSKLKRLEP